MERLRLGRAAYKRSRTSIRCGDGDGWLWEWLEGDKRGDWWWITAVRGNVQAAPGCKNAEKYAAMIHG